MAYKHIIEAVNRSFQDIMKLDKPFGDNTSFNRTSFAQNAILTPRNVNVDSINIKLINKIPGDLITYISADETIIEDEATFYPTEFLNSLSISGLPPHKLLLKVGVPIILMRNLNSASGGIVSGSFLSTKVLIPRISLIPTDSGLPFSLKRLQFPVRPAFVMTIIKLRDKR
ncbi:uncharacterized protein LOC135927053 [Gordionus sp. m RMFG-2023]|uniref:uncharacterized protein LOC135927053 n=1 Tax=Gordionus sp. m RMFG-2023 TaxID=3053472 RepID=UPI0031FCED96